MYTVEFEHDAAIITTLDEENLFNELELIIADDNTVYLKQHDDEMDDTQIIVISYQQLLDVLASVNSQEGAFYTRLIRGGYRRGKMGAA